MEMKKNVGASDRYIRVILGIGFILNVFSLEPSRFGMFILLLLGFSLLYSAFTQYCWIYDLLKINTREKAPREEKPAEQTPSH